MVMALKKEWILSVALFLLSPSIYAKNLGVLGPVFEIKEKDMVEMIEQKLKMMEVTETLAYHQNQLLEKAKRSLQTPLPVLHLKETITSRTFTWDPSITLTYDIKNHQNQLIYAKGTHVNPLDTVSFKGQWLFFNGDDLKQQAWAKALYKTGDKFILVRGSPMQLMQEWDLPVYFDQQGLLTRKIGIQQYPARLYQEGKVLKVEEIRLEEKRS